MSIYSIEIFKKPSHFLIKHVTREIADVRDLAGNWIASASSPGIIREM